MYICMYICLCAYEYVYIHLQDSSQHPRQPHKTHTKKKSRASSSASMAPLLSSSNRSYISPSHLDVHDGGRYGMMIQVCTLQTLWLDSQFGTAVTTRGDLE